LFLLNHPFALAQTEALARRLQREAPADDRVRISWLYRLLYGRPPTSQELGVGLRALHAASNSGSSAEGAWEQLCQVLVCANEFIYVD
jgi:hypothetical protein